MAKDVFRTWRSTITTLGPTGQRTGGVGFYAFAVFPPAPPIRISGNKVACMGDIHLTSPGIVVGAFVLGRCRRSDGRCNWGRRRRARGRRRSYWRRDRRRRAIRITGFWAGNVGFYATAVFPLASPIRILSDVVARMGGIELTSPGRVVNARGDWRRSSNR